MEEKRKILYEGKFLRLIKEGRWEYVDRVNASGAVMVVAVTEQRELILVEEYRYPLHAHTIGLPAGIAGDMGEESHLESARRELEEESGFTAGRMTFLCEGPSSPGLTTEMVSFWLAEKVRRTSAGGGVDQENIAVHLIPLDEVDAWLEKQRDQGKIIDPKIYLGLYFLNVRDQE